MHSLPALFLAIMIFALLMGTLLIHHHHYGGVALDPSQTTSTDSLLVQVHTKMFDVQGTTMTISRQSPAVVNSTDVTSAEVFFGVPYAQPPVGVDIQQLGQCK